MQTVRRLNEEGCFPFSVLIHPPRVSFEMDVMNRFEITSVSHKNISPKYNKYVQNKFNVCIKNNISL